MYVFYFYYFNASYWFTSFEVFVNGTPVAATKSNIDDKFVINLTTAYSIDDTVSYVLNLNEKGPDAWKNVDDTDFSADANDIVEWDGSKWVNIWNSSEDNETTYVTNMIRQIYKLFIMYIMYRILYQFAIKYD